MSGPAPISVDIDTAAKMLGVSRATMFVLIAAGDVRSYKVGARRLFRVADLEAFAAERVEVEQQQLAGA